MKLRTKLIFSVLAGSLFISAFAGMTCFYYTNSKASALTEVLTVFSASLFFALLIIIMIGNPTIKYFGVFTEAIDKVTKGDLDVKVYVKSEDEIGQLAKAFNAMIVSLQSDKENIEKKVAERTADLEKINKFMVGREIKMIDLKKQISELSKNQCHRD